MTLAALPVGAKRTAFFWTCHKFETKVLIIEVLPVPACPRNMKISGPEGNMIKSVN